MPEETEIRRILVVTAHPDDVDFGAAGTVATWTEAGIEVTYAIVTSGDAGEAFPDTPRSEVGALRESEQLAAAKCVGVTDVRFLGSYPRADGGKPDARPGTSDEDFDRARAWLDDLRA